MTAGPEHFADIATRQFVRLKEMTMSQPSELIGQSCRDTVRDLVVRGVRTAEIHRHSAIPLLEAIGVDSGEAVDLVDAAEEAGA